MKSKKVGLVILDGWGHGKKDNSNAIFCAETPFVDSLYSAFANAELRTDGEHVGLPDGQMGNSEVGHMNIGAGRIVYQDLLKIDLAVRNNTLETNPQLLEFLGQSRVQNNTLHLMGLVSDGGVHSHQEHLFALIRIAKANGIKKIYIHAFTDGRDTDPKSGLESIEKLQFVADENEAQIASVSGRYYAMDRDLRWDRIKKTYSAMVQAKGASALSAKEVITASYQNDVTDEFIEPTWIADSEGKPIGTIAEGDSVLCFNFRTDRCRQISRALTQESFPDFEMEKLSLN
ncbi:MAG: 2,3-bisphosphoglycerate-independent phosphoglycerate mutase, partial [Flavobacteriales bacterium]